MTKSKERWSQVNTLRQIAWVLDGVLLVSLEIARLLGFDMFRGLWQNVLFVALGIDGIIQNHMTGETTIGTKLLLDAGFLAGIVLHVVTALKRLNVISFPDHFNWLISVGTVIVIVCLVIVYLRQRGAEKKVHDNPQATEKTGEE